MNTTLQVPVDSALKSRATKAAKAMGFSSLQETVRLFLNKLARGDMHVELTTFDADEYVSPKAIARYNQMEQDIESGKVKTTVAHSVDELMKQLNEKSS
jgi:antitoxin component of RelBE/YafQ-DinJ toxin-antitoxin module